jgi:hypothetical protein
MDDGLPIDVKEFIRQPIVSLAQLEVLLALRCEQDRIWTDEEMTSHLFLQRSMVSALLIDLEQRGLARQHPSGFQYGPTSDELRELVDRLAQLYQKRRVAVITEIIAKPIDPARAFADAFRLRKRS